MGDFLGQISSPISAGIGLIQSSIDAKNQRERDERQFRDSREQATIAYNRDLEMWNKANEYNAPTQQMARFREAGVNPNLIYGKGGASAGTAAASMPKYQAPRPEYRYQSPVNLMSALGAFQSQQKHNAEMDILRSEGKLRESEAQFRDDILWQKSYMLQSKAQREALKYGIESRRPSERDIAALAWKWDTAAGRMQTEQLQAAKTRNELLAKDLEYYLANHLGGTALNAVKSVGGGVMRFRNMLKAAKAGRAIPKISNPWKSSNSLRKEIDTRYRNNRILDKYRTGSFD